MKTLLYVATDGNYGDARDLLLVDADNFTNEDFLDLDGVDDGERAEEAAEIANYRMAEPLVWAWMTRDESAQVLDALEAAVAHLIETGAPGLAEQLGDIRDVLNRSGITL